MHSRAKSAVAFAVVTVAALAAGFGGGALHSTPTPAATVGDATATPAYVDVPTTGATTAPTPAPKAIPTISPTPMRTAAPTASARPKG